MELTRTEKLSGLNKTALLVIPIWKDGKPLYQKQFPHLKEILEDGGFSGSEGETMMTYVPGGKILLLGLGVQGEATTEKLRRAYGTLAKLSLKKKYRKLSIALPEAEGLDEEAVVRGVTEGLFLANYNYDKLKKNKTALIESINLIGISKTLFVKLKDTVTLFESVNFARDLINGNADDVTPEYLAAMASEAAKKTPIKVTVLDKKGLKKEKMGLILAVNRASPFEPRLIVMEYTGQPKSKEKIVLIGKGVTYDTGGLSLKSTGMEDMKADMSGAAVVMATLKAAAMLKLKVNVSCVIAATENCIGPLSYKLGDVYTSHSGITVEVNNTDAEGRLVLADAISWTQKYLKPTAMIDVATLTGAMGIALGHDGIGLFSTHDALADSLITAGSDTYERVFRMPLIEEYRESLNSDVADMRNSGGRIGSSIIAALFLKEFVNKDIPWAHLDIAPVAFSTVGRRYFPNYASGIGVRLLIDYLKGL